jgi:hypothetical protein
MKLQHSFWLIGLAAVFAMPLASSQCAGASEPQTVASATTTHGLTIHASDHTSGITITGVN